MRAVVLWLFVAVVALSSSALSVSARTDATAVAPVVPVAPAAPPRPRAPKAQRTALKGARLATKAANANAKGQKSLANAGAAKNRIAKAVHNKRAAGHFANAEKKMKASKKMVDPNSQSAATRQAGQAKAEEAKKHAKIDAARALGPKGGKIGRGLDGLANKAKTKATDKVDNKSIIGIAKNLKDGWAGKSMGKANGKANASLAKAKTQNPFKRGYHANKAIPQAKKAAAEGHKIANSLPKGSVERAEARKNAKDHELTAAKAKQVRNTAVLPLPSTYKGGGVKGAAAKASRGLSQLVRAPFSTEMYGKHLEASRANKKVDALEARAANAANANGNGNGNGAAPA